MDENARKRVEEIRQNRIERQQRRQLLRALATQRFYKSMQLLQADERERDSKDEPFEDYSLYVYRQTAPSFEERVKDLEKKLLYPVRWRQLPLWCNF